MSNSKQKIFRIPRTRPYFYLTRGVYRGGEMLHPRIVKEAGGGHVRREGFQNKLK